MHLTAVHFIRKARQNVKAKLLLKYSKAVLMYQHHSGIHDWASKIYVFGKTIIGHVTLGYAHKPDLYFLCTGHICCFKLLII